MDDGTSGISWVDGRLDAQERVVSRFSTLTASEDEKAIVLDAWAQEEVTLDAIWGRLVTGHWHVENQFTTESRHYLVVKPQRRPAEELEVDLLLRTLLGERQKVIALESDLSPSTITTRLACTLAKMGFPPKPARVPILLVAAAAVATDRVRLPAARVTRWSTPSGELMIVSTTRLDAHLRDVLTPAEGLVARLLVDGLSHREIAARRGSTSRTVANQVASIFRKLDVSGRRELLLRAIARYVDADEQVVSSDLQVG
jgi:DNA-binding NarL/FixJ family response regulator